MVCRTDDTQRSTVKLVYYNKDRRCSVAAGPQVQLLGLGSRVAGAALVDSSRVAVVWPSALQKSTVAVKRRVELVVLKKVLNWFL